MNILLIYPEFPDTFWGFKYALKFVHKRSAFPPLGLLTVASMLPADWSRRLVDTNVKTLCQRDLKWADCVFISAMVAQRNSVQKISARCKEAGLPVVAGGPLFIEDHEQFPDVDHFVLNEAELTLPGFLKDWSDGCPKRIYSTKEFADLSRTPRPHWELLNLRRYAGMSIQFSRGCPFNCDFCNVTTLLGHRTRIKTTEQIIAELDDLYDLGWRENIFFVDDNFIGNKKFLKDDLLPALIKWRKNKRGITFYTEASINLADDESLMKMMVQAGFNKVFVGIETPDELCLKECRKIQNKGRDLLQDIKLIQNTGIEVQGGFIVGFDHDQPSIFRQQIDFIQQSGIVTAMVGLLQAVPGTPMYERLNKEGRLCGELSGDNVDCNTNFRSVMDCETLREGYKGILRHIYAPKNFYSRIRTYIRNSGRECAKPSIHLTDIYALFLSFWVLGIVGRERFQYWSLMLDTLLRRPQKLPAAITLAIYGYHFRKICDQYVR